MAKTLNDPRVVLPLAGFALLFLVYRAAPDLFSVARYLPKSEIKEVLDFKYFADAKPEADSTQQAMRSLAVSRWLPANCQPKQRPSQDPFYYFVLSEQVLPADEAELLIELDPEMFDRYIAEHLGLDAQGFFVRFGTIRKRAGDLLRTTAGRELVLQKIGIAEFARSPDEHLRAVTTVLEKIKLMGVMRSKASIDATRTVADVELDLANNPAVAAERQSALADASAEDAAYISGGFQLTNIYKVGEFVYRNPSIGLLNVYEQRVDLVDRWGNVYSLEL